MTSVCEWEKYTMKKAKQFLILAILILCVAAESWWLFRETPDAEQVYPVPGIVTADPSCNMRQDPNTSREAVRELRKDVQLTVLAEVEGEDVGGSTVWYEIQYGNIFGYVSAQFVRIVNEVPAAPGLPAPVLPGESEMAAALAAEGFPSDYQALLMELWRAHPTWTFKALHTNYPFETAVRGEYRPGINLVTSNSPPEFKSTAEADFNFVTNSWYEYESGWVGASEELIAYQMDPRNFLDEIQIFQFENQRYNASMDYRYGLANILKSSFMDGPGPVRYKNTNGDAAEIQSSYMELIREAGELSGVSPYHLASRILQEVSRDGSHSVSGEYQDIKGYYNFYNIGATGGADPVYMGLVTARDGLPGYSPDKIAKMLFPWDDPRKSIAGGAVFIGEDYINVDQQTLYLQKFNLVSRFSRPFTHQYMGNVLAPEYEAIDVYKAYEQMGTLDDPKEFLIPVFVDMPSVVPSPAGGGNPNNWLRGIMVNGQLIQNFKPSKYEYNVEISAASRGIVVQAATWNPNSFVSGPGIYQLNPGRNEIILQVMAPTGAVRNYRLSVYQKEETADKDPDALPRMDSSTYKIDALGYVYGIDPNTGGNTRDSILAGFPVSDSYQTDLRDASGSPVSGTAGTGSVLTLSQNGQILNEFPLVILGDTNGDGSIDVMDLNATYASVISSQKASSTALEKAMDVNQDGSADILDLNLIFAHVSGTQSISQTLLE